MADNRVFKRSIAERTAAFTQRVPHVRARVRVAFDPFVFDHIIDHYAGDGLLDADNQTAELISVPVTLRGIEVSIRARSSRVWHRDQWHAVTRADAREWTVAVGETQTYHLVTFGYMFHVRDRDFANTDRWLDEWERMIYELAKPFDVSNIHEGNYSWALPFQRLAL